jgi:hypothetical protein
MDLRLAFGPNVAASSGRIAPAMLSLAVQLHSSYDRSSVSAIQAPQHLISRLWQAVKWLNWLYREHQVLQASLVGKDKEVLSSTDNCIPLRRRDYVVVGTEVGRDLVTQAGSFADSTNKELKFTKLDEWIHYIQ